MYSITNKVQVFGLIAAITLVGLGSVGLPTSAFAQVDNSGCCDTGTYYDTSSAVGSYYDTSSPTGSYYDTSSPTGSYYDTSSPTGSYYDTSSGTGSYYDTSSPTGTYYDTSSPSGTYYDTSSAGGSYYDTSSPAGSYYDTSSPSGTYFDTSSPTYSYSTPSYTTGGYSVTNPSYSTGGGSYGSTAYSTPSYGYSGGTVRITGGTGYSTPIYTPTPVTHTTTPTPIVYTQPTGVVQQQQQQQTAQPIIINNNTNTNTNTNSAPVTQIVNTPPQQVVDYVYQQPAVVYNNPTPVSCSISASPNSVAIGQPTVLSWSSYGAVSATLSDGIGSVAPNGTIVARPSSTANYVLTVYGQGTTATCNVVVSVAGSMVSLTQIPYTGFDFGPVGDAMYWAALLAFALAAAYLLVYYRGGAFAFATALAGGRTKFAPVKFTDAESDTVDEVPAVETAPAAANHRLTSVFANLPVAEVRRATSDAMIVNHSTNGSAPRIVISRA